MISESTSGKNKQKAQAMNWKRASGNNDRHLWDTLPGHMALQEVNMTAGTRNNGTNTLVEAVLAIWPLCSILQHS